MREAGEVAGLVGDDDVRRELRGKTVVDLLTFEPREHAIGRRGRDELPFGKQREERTDRVWRRPVVLGVVERHMEVRDSGLLEGRVDARAPEDPPKRQRGPVVGDRDHRLERLVERELRAGVLERPMSSGWIVIVSL